MKATRNRDLSGWLGALAALWLLVSTPAWSGAPTEVLKGTIDQVLGILADSGRDIAAKREAIRAVIDTRFDYRAMAQRTLAQNWRGADDAQRARFTELYARLMQDTYLVLVEEYNNQSVEYGDERIRKEKYAEVKTEILDAGKRIPVNYKLRLKGDDWLVYDVVIENVSMINNYRSSYQQIVRKDGMDGLIARLEEKLASAAAPPAD